jgi:hypothetical protein
MISEDSGFSKERVSYGNLIFNAFDIDGRFIFYFEAVGSQVSFTLTDMYCIEMQLHSNQMEQM